MPLRHIETHCDTLGSVDHGRFVGESAASAPPKGDHRVAANDSWNLGDLDEDSLIIMVNLPGLEEMEGSSSEHLGSLEFNMEPWFLK